MPIQPELPQFRKVYLPQHITLDDDWPGQAVDRYLLVILAP